MSAISASPVGSPPTIKTQPNAVKPIMLGLQQPQGQAGQQPGAAPASQDPAGQALQQQDIDKGQKAMQENEALKTELNMHKQVANIATSGASGFLGAQVQGLMKNMPKLQSSIAKLKFATGMPAPNAADFPALNPAKLKNFKPAPVPAAPLTPSQMAWKPKQEAWQAEDAWDKQRDTSLFTQAANNSSFYNRPSLPSIMDSGAPVSWRNVVEGANEVLRSPVDAAESYLGPTISNFTQGLRTDWKSQARPNSLRSWLAGSVDALTGGIADTANNVVTRGLPGIAQAFSSPLELGRDVYDLVPQLRSKGLLDAQWGKDVHTRLGDHLRDLPGNAMYAAGSLTPGGLLASVALPSVAPSVLQGAMGLMTPQSSPSESPAGAAPAGSASPAPEPQLPTGVLPWLAQLIPALQGYLGGSGGGAPAPEQGSLPSAAGAAGHAVRNPAAYA